MELLQLRYFLELANTENMTKTAQKLYISPSSLSTTISRLEKELGAPLFTRSGRNITLNRTGKHFAENVKAALESLDYAVTQVKLENAVSIIIDSPALWSKMLANYIAAQPDIAINTRGFRKEEITQDKLRYEYDFWLSACPLNELDPAQYDMLEYRQLSRNRLYLAVPDTHPLADRKSVSLKELKDEQFIFPLKGNRFYDVCMEMCNAGGFEPDVIGCGGFFVRIQMLTDGQGIAFINDMYPEVFKHVVIIEIEEADQFLSDGVAIFWHKQKEMSDDGKKFLRYITQYYRE